MMKKFCAFFVVLLLIAVSSISDNVLALGPRRGGLRDYSSTAGGELAYWYPFVNGTGEIVSRYGNMDRSGVLNNMSHDGVNSGWVFDDIRGDVMAFDGTDDYMHINMYGGSARADRFFFTKSFSISCWLRPHDGNPPAWQSPWGHAQSTFAACILYIGTGGHLYFFYDASPGVAGVSAQSNTPVFVNGLNDWHHIVCVANDAVWGIGGLLLYVDGEERVLDGVNDGDTTGIPFADYAVATTFLFGARNVSPQYYYDGLMDDARMYDRALTAQEVKRLYDDTNNYGTSQYPIIDNSILDKFAKNEPSADLSDEWASIAIDGIREGTEVDLSSYYSTTLQFSVVTSNVVTHNVGATVLLQVSSNTSGDEDWTTLAVIDVCGSAFIASRQAVGVELAGSTVLEVADTTGYFDHDETRWTFLQENGDVTTSELLYLVSHVTNTSLTVLDPTTYDHGGGDYVYDMAWSYSVPIPFVYNRARVIYDNTKSGSVVIHVGMNSSIPPLPSQVIFIR